MAADQIVLPRINTILLKEINAKKISNLEIVIVILVFAKHM